VAAVAIVGLQGRVGGDFKDNFRVPGVESQKAVDILNQRFPTQSGATGRIVFHTDHRLDTPAARAAIDDTRNVLAGRHHLVGVSDPFTMPSMAVSADGRTAYVDVQYSVQTLKVEHLADATKAVSAARHAGVEAELTGSITSAGDKAKGKEGIGVLVAVVVLLLAFGSAIAMGIPIGTRPLGVAIGVAGMKVLAGFVDVPSVSEMLGMMIGLGVGIDYALFVVTRHRQHLHEGMAVADAAGTANATAGQAVLFAGG